jgi:hypothetical protein
MEIGEEPMRQRLRMTRGAAHFAARVAQLALLAVASHTGSGGFIVVAVCRIGVSEKLIKGSRHLSCHVGG